MPALALPTSALEPWCQLSAAEEDAENSSGVLMAEEQLLSPGGSSEAPETVQEVHSSQNQSWFIRTVGLLVGSKCPWKGAWAVMQLLTMSWAACSSPADKSPQALAARHWLKGTTYLCQGRNAWSTSSSLLPPAGSRAGVDSAATGRPAIRPVASAGGHSLGALPAAGLASAG